VTEARDFKGGASAAKAAWFDPWYVVAEATTHKHGWSATHRSVTRVTKVGGATTSKNRFEIEADAEVGECLRSLEKRCDLNLPR
jgi:hypothetical protein